MRTRAEVQLLHAFQNFHVFRPPNGNLSECFFCLGILQFVLRFWGFRNVPVGVCGWVVPLCEPVRFVS